MTITIEMKKVDAIKEIMGWKLGYGNGGVPEEVAKKAYNKARKEYLEDVKLFGHAFDEFEEYIYSEVHEYYYPDC